MTNQTLASVNPVVVTFLSLLACANAVLVDSPILNSWDVEAPTGDDSNAVAHFSWVDEDGLGFTCTLTEGGIAQGEWVDDSFFCSDAEGDPVQVSLLKHIALTPTTM